MREVLCEKTTLLKVKEKLFKTVIKPEMTYESEFFANNEKKKIKIKVVEMRMLIGELGQN